MKKTNLNVWQFCLESEDVVLYEIKKRCIEEVLASVNRDIVLLETIAQMLKSS